MDRHRPDPGQTAHARGHITARAHLALRTHLPRRDWCWVGLRLRCRYCGQRYPCPPRLVALRHLGPRDRKENRT